MKILGNGIAVIEGDLISKWVEENGRLDHDLSAVPIITSHIKNDTNVIDIGAFIGDHTIAYAKKTKGKVYAFEPNKKAFECLLHNMMTLDNVTCYNVALGLHNGRVNMNEDESNIGANFLTYNENGDVSIVKLDEYNFTDIGLIKIDAEGFEIDILKGAKQTIDTNRPILVIEVNKGALERNGANEAKLFELLKELKYNCENIYKGQKMEGDQYDIICKPI
jgi:FkbM family methyltransferase